MAGIGIDRATLSDMFHQGMGLGEPDDDLTPGQIMRLSVAVAKVIDENNVSIANALKYAGVKLKSND